MASDCSRKAILQDVVAFVEVWSSNKTENYSKPFVGHLIDMGAKVLKYFNKQVTHVVFKDGHESVWKKAKRTGVKLVSVLWVERCMATGTHVDESLFPAMNESKFLPENKRTHRCMKPRDFIEKTPENDKRLQKKLDQMIQNLDSKKTIGADPPLLLFDEDATGLNMPKMKSVPLNQFCGMVERLKEMKEKRENLSPTASQMSQSISGSATSLCQPFLGESPTITPKRFAEELVIDSEGASINDPCGSFVHEKKIPLLRDAYEEQMDQHSRPESSVESSHLFSPNSDLIKETSQRRRKKTVAKTKLHISKKKNLLASLDDDGASPSSCNVERKYSEGENGEAFDSATPELKLYSNISKTNIKLSPPDQTTSIAKECDFAETGCVSNVHYKNNASPLKPKCSPASKENQTSSRKNGKLCKNQIAHLKPTGIDLFKAKDFSSSFPDDYPTNGDVMVYEDFFSPVNLKGQNKPRPSLGVLPPESPSPPRLSFGSVKQKRKSQETNHQHFIGRTKRARGITNFSTGEQSNASIYNNNEPLNVIALVDKNNHDCQNDSHQPAAATVSNRRKSHIKQLLEHFLDESEELSNNEVSEKIESHLHRNNGERKVDLLANDSTLTYFCGHSKGIKLSSDLHTETKTNSLNSIKLIDQLNKEQTEKEKVQCHQEDKLSKNFLTLKTTDSDLEDKHLCAPRQSHNKKCNTTEVTHTTIGCKGKNIKPSRTLVMTSMPSENQIIVIQIVKQLGGFLFSDQVTETTTHVIAGHPRRTLNILFGIARGCWILSFDWILWSLEQGCWVPEEPYELSAQFPAATICRLEKQSTTGVYQQDLFSNQPLIFISTKSEPPTLMLEKLVQLCGGKVCKTLRKAGICIGQYKGKRPPESQHLSENWILDCITQHKLCSIDGYILE
ncbi:microcephalin [Carcharodon carcharias]|uniref:microcephalin n=1 Tax=Carcharodon carcharias TaxID=13397 RepID=UPI001B7E37FB|nr:microcephalin [Carcharodon carcharias]XP_041044189.1 microcephalin [Carcharodon carcharias]XP_041044190.1 microcephalin [Carcharodon carcharias]